ncbi:LPXTG cell wall anchor domain-containing protein [Aeromicrobium sp. NPDC092404]|uniref:LPXTG cell wall anchor domain-containing protein n=1 Tax=Aeromicrobium sp. NPDC092404 TaxID=3154976 RepID=UPI00343139F2
MRKLALSFVLAIGLVLVVAPPASAADEIGLSRDGVTFAPSLGGPLFDPAFLWVPSDVESETFYVRNQGGTTARLTVDILGEEVSALMDSGDLDVTATSGGTSTTVSDKDEHRLLTIPGVEANEIVPVTITVAFDAASTNETQLLSSDLNFRINLRQTSAVVGDGEDDNDDNGLLPDTGAQAPLWLAALAAIGIGSGAALISRRRTQPEGASHG